MPQDEKTQDSKRRGEKRKDSLPTGALWDG